VYNRFHNILHIIFNYCELSLLSTELQLKLCADSSRRSFFESIFIFLFFTNQSFMNTEELALRS
ncbi:MAG: hypothetical protein ACTSRI_21435, partial [Promethearchaeota archaeon]